MLDSICWQRRTTNLSCIEDILQILTDIDGERIFTAANNLHTRRRRDLDDWDFNRGTGSLGSHDVGV